MVIYMEMYPKLLINLKSIEKNAQILSSLCSSCGVSIAGVIKGAGGSLFISKALISGGCSQIGSSRVEQLKAVKDMDVSIPTMLIRIPMLCELPYVVRYCDYSLNSEEYTLRALDKQSSLMNTKHNIILMYELGDRREGAPTLKDLLRLARLVEYELTNLHLSGIGANLNCVCAIRPTIENMNLLANAAEKVEETIGRRLEIISGGSTTTLPMLYNGLLPKKINHLRIGEALIDNRDLEAYWDCHIPGLQSDCLSLQAQIIERNIKDTSPEGIQVLDAFGHKPQVKAMGPRKRAIIAFGKQDLGDPKQLIPKDPKIKVFASSSDHTILDIHECTKEYKVGDIVEFNLYYECMLFAFLSDSVQKKYIFH